MNHADLVALIQDGVTAKGGRWADLGAGEGAFTLALADLLGPSAQITAVDKDPGSLRRLASAAGTRPGTIETMVGDFTLQLHLIDLDGVVMANSLHFTDDKAPVLKLVHSYLKPSGRLIVVEYDVDSGNPWVPFPFSFATWSRLAVASGFSKPVLIGRHESRWLRGLYSAVSTRQ